MVSQEQRRRQLAREKFLRQQQRRTEARRKSRIRNSVIASVLGVVLVGSLALYTTGTLKQDDDKTNANAEVSPSASATSKAPDPCDKPAKGKVKSETWKKEPAMSIDKSAKYTLKLDTTCGAIDVALKASAAPHTVNSFDFLAKKGYFDHSKCHRLTTNGIYVLQCGDPTGTGTGGPGYTIPDENLKDKSLKDNIYPAGTVAMANTGQKDSGGSQFFLVYQDSQLPPSYTPFGTVSEAGMKVLKKIADAGESTGAGDGAPNATVVIDKATVTQS
ncbi:MULTISPECIES: peptidylprolyl isomerase [Streptomyces]|uniref:Peptidyl-prolyl cis-trans isomerase B (Cyclophilin B) n=2 Tax=Streptomyces TaxID=1883 RepID=A0A514JXL6_9ACTN|nr:peptidylprolyl isomerase [Streptomyces calvus]MYS30272.1 peptidylprolyl isomerase [Streptomyces sp. SID7804]MBA8947230.1 peptidyl-prolyl cis-trans isomerase B (cyclophilin B) [Streptomyces calvus]MBA8973802.1 peptidyl-prolyl cis-trans isomerase B (cyclophilin B) [Streptomyces calvus]QDI72141.1 peptidylprolyl isomerase [Streptomyces calvus]GGP76060.1 peptidyl-prolyl cis-trans isomerase [Streptomyces calvus]